MRKNIYWLGIALAGVLALYFVFFAFNALKQYELKPLLTVNLSLAIAAAALLYSLIIPISGWAWHVLLRGMGVHWRSDSLAAIMGVTQLAKYVPGNLGQHIGRATLALAKGMSGASYTGSVVVETVLAMSAGLLVGLAFALLSPVQAASVLVEHRFALGLVAAALGVTAFAFPFLFRNLRRFVLKLPIRIEWQTMHLESPGRVAVVLAFSAYCLNYLLIGFGLWLIAHAIDAPIQTDYLYLTAVFALSWLLGFLTPGAPAGLGVREGTMALLLAGVGQDDAVLLVIAAMRIATIAGDGLVFILSMWYLRVSRLVNHT